MKIAIKIILILSWMIFMSVCMTGCKTVYVPVETVKMEFIERVRRDSIHLLDSVIIREKSGFRVDTVEITRWRFEYRDKLRVDSVYITDSIQVPFPVERQLSKWQRIKMDLGGIAMGGLAAVVIGLISWFIIQMRRK